MFSVFHSLKKRNVFVNLTVDNKKDLLDRLIASFKGDVSAKEYQAIGKAVFQREKMISTGVGNGVALPHGKSPKITNQHTALAVLKSPVDYDSLDGEPVSIVFLFAGPDSKTNAHLNIMSKISGLMNDKNFRQSLVQHQTKDDLYHFLTDEA